MIRIFVVLVVLLVPLVGAHAPSDGSVSPIQWSRHIYSADNIVEWNGDVVVTNFTRPHNYSVVESDVSLVYSATLSIDTGAGEQALRLTTELNGFDMAFCDILIRDDGTITMPGIDSNYGGVRCPAKDGGLVNRYVFGENNTFTFNRSGAAAVDDMIASVYLVVEDTVMIPSELTINTAFDAWLPFVVLFALITVAAWRGWNLVIYPCVVGMILFLWDTPLMPFEWIWGIIIVFFAWHALREIVRVRRVGRKTMD